MMRRGIILVVFALALLASSLVGVLTVQAQYTSDGKGFPLASGVNIVSPINSTYGSNVLELNVTIKSLLGPSIYRFELTYSIDRGKNTTIPTTATFVPVEAIATYPNGTTATVTSVFSYYLAIGCVTLPELPESSHTVTVYAKYERINGLNTNWPLLVLDDSTVCFTIDYGIPPVISNLSVENKTYSQNSLPLNFTTDKSTSWMSYSLDGKENVTVAEDTTLTGLADGSHRLTVYANDTVGNMGTSETHFSIEVPEPFPTTLVGASASVAVTSVGLFVFFYRRNGHECQ
jgi:hypothetical protein